MKNTKSWNPFVGCKFDCIYCEDSYKKLLKWNGRLLGCMKCQSYRPHNHPERLERMPTDRVIFVCSNGDISSCSLPFASKIFEIMRKDGREGRIFLLQSKNPGWFSNFLNELPRNTVLMTTIETNRDSQYQDQGVSKAPLPSQRFNDFLKLDWPRKALVMEPILDFDLEIIESWVLQIKPEKIFVGFESKRRCKLIEPTPSKVADLHERLESLEFDTYDKSKFKYRDVF